MSETPITQMLNRLRPSMSDDQIKAELVHYLLMNMDETEVDGPPLSSPDDFVKFVRSELFQQPGNAT